MKKRWLVEKYRDIIANLEMWRAKNALRLELTHLERQLITALSERELYSLQIEQTVTELRGQKVRFGTLYPVLRSLEKRGFLTAWWKIGASPSPKRRCYRATALGEQTLQKVYEREADVRRHTG